MWVVWSPSALGDVARIYGYIANFNPSAATTLAEALLAQGDSLADFPDRGRLASENLREITVLEPYIIRYEVIGGFVQILRVRHGKRQQ